MGEYNNERGWMPSNDDETSAMEWFHLIRDTHSEPLIDLIVSVSMLKKSRTAKRKAGNRLEFNIAGCRIAITAYRIFSTGEMSNEYIELKSK